MEREIIFRGKNIHTGEWLYGDYHRVGKTHYITKPGDFLREYAPIEFIVNEKTVEQFTGLYDANNKPIYEGDIVKFHFMTSRSYTTELFPTEKFFGEITVNKYNQWVVLSDGLEVHIENAVKYGEIIGNIHDNPIPNKR